MSQFTFLATSVTQPNYTVIKRVRVGKVTILSRFSLILTKRFELVAAKLV